MGSSDHLRVESSRSGMPTLVRRGVYVHSRHDPAREARRALAELVRRDPPVVVLIGLGLGYHVRELVDSSTADIIVFEPSEEVRRLAFDVGPLDRTDLERVRLAASPDELALLLPALASAGFETLETRGIGGEDGTIDARAVVARFASRLEINRNTLARFGRLWVRNLCRNLEHLALARGVGELERTMEGLPVLMLAAGPTLDQVLPHLPELARRALVVAVDTAVAPCLRAGVEPDFAVVVDPQYWNARHLDRLKPEGSLLVSEPSAHPVVFRRFDEPAFLCSSVFPLGRAFEEVLGRFGSLGACGSVSTTAWDLARLLGSSEFYTAGLDLGFPDGRTHCSGSFFEELALELAERTTPAEQVIFRYTRGAGAAEVPANDGGTLLSDRRMDVYRGWFTTQLRLAGAPSTRSLTRGGSAISGLALGTPDDLLALPDRRDEISAAVDRIRRSARPDHVARTRMLGARVGELERLLSELAETAEAGVHEVRLIAREHERGERVDFTPLLEIDARLSGHPAGEIGSFLVQEAIHRIREGYGSASVDEQIDASRTMYEGLAEAARFHASELSAAASRISQTTR